jgi:ribose-phosphate pyrophosphokinase
VVCDLGYARRARDFADLLKAPLAIVQKRRIGNTGESQLLSVIGDVKGKRAIIVDDEIDRAGTLMNTIQALEAENVGEIYSCCTHAVLSGPAIERLQARDSLREVVVTDTIQLAAEKAIPKITVLSVAPLFGEAIKRIHSGESVGVLFR